MDVKAEAQKRGLNWTVGYWCDVWPEPRWRAWLHVRGNDEPDAFGESTESEEAALATAWDVYIRAHDGLQ